MRTAYVGGTCRSQKWVSRLLKPELWVIVIHDGNARN